MDRYIYRVSWSEEDGEYVGLCVEFPSLSWLDSSHEKAFRGIRKIVGEVIADMQANNEKLPDPLSTKKYSGKFQVRIPVELHRKLAVTAAEQQISLNRLVSSRLAGQF
jgi:predicted HicB family RNase H-like nuclease